jgi:hypothetical protein
MGNCMMGAPVPGKKGHGHAWLTSSGLATEKLVCEFMRVLLERRGAFDPADKELDAKSMRAKYASTLAKVKVFHTNDGNYHKPGEACRTGRANRVTFFWDLELAEHCGIKPENITTVALYEKPWLFNRPGEEGKHDAASPNVPNLDPKDEALYFAKLDQMQAAIDAVRAGKTAVKLPSGMSYADELASVSQQLEAKYPAALARWCKRTFDEIDLGVGQGGDVVMVNLALQINGPFVKKLIEAVRTGKIFYATMSASTMVCSLTSEILPGSLECFSVDKQYLSAGFDAIDLDEDGIKAAVLRAMPLFKMPFAMRPHFTTEWLDKVLAKNLEAEKEFELEMGMEVDDAVVADSAHGLEVALTLLNIISANAKDQDNPVYVPLLDGQAISCHFHGKKESFAEVDIGNKPPIKAKVDDYTYI